MASQNAETQRKLAWKKYYEAKRDAHQGNLDVFRVVAPDAVGASIPTPHAEAFQTMVAAVRKHVLCLVCEAVVETGDVQWASCCGQHYHKACYDATRNCKNCAKRIAPRKTFQKRRWDEDGGRDFSFSAFAQNKH